MTDLLNAKIIATREDILNAIAAAPNRHEAVQNSKLCQPYIPIINRFIDGYHHPRTALDFKTILFEASSGSVGRNESLIWQQGRDI